MRQDAGRRLVAGVDALYRLIDEGGVLDRPGQRSDGVEGEGEGIDAGAAHAPDRRLEADRAAERGGGRTEPPVSLPSAMGTSPAATAAAEPLDEPTGA